jgi:hypothetical protein
MMNDYYSLYTWAMDRQADLQREAAERKLARHSPYVNTHDNSRLRWPLARRRVDENRKAA